MTADMGLGRFTVRDVNIFDGPRILSLFGDPDIVRYLGVKQIHTLDEASELIQRYANSQTRWLVVQDKETNRFEGIVGLEVRGHQATLFITFAKHARGAGREFSVPFVKYLFTQPQIWRVWAYCHVDNVAVQRVLERMGADCEGRMRRFEIFPNLGPEPQDVYVYAITR